MSTPIDDVGAVLGMIAEIYLTWERYRQRQIMPFGVSLKQYYVLRQLEDVAYLNPSQIAAMLFCDRPTASVIIRNLERDGLVAREHDPDNLRKYRISLTAAGAAKVAEIRGSSFHPPAFDPLATLSVAEVRRLRSLLARVHRHILVLNEAE